MNRIVINTSDETISIDGIELDRVFSVDAHLGAESTDSFVLIKMDAEVTVIAGTKKEDTPDQPT